MKKTTNKLEANEVEANKLEANKLEANKLEANKLEANKLEVSEVLQRLVVRFERPNSWCQKRDRVGDSVCLSRGISLECLEVARLSTREMTSSLSDQVHTRIKEVINLPNYMGIIDFNDHYARNREQIVEAVKKAIEYEKTE